MSFGRACAPVRCAHPSFSAHFLPKQGAASPAHRSFAASQKYIKSTELGPPTSKAFFFPLDHMQTAEAMKYEVPWPAHRSFADPYRNILGSKLCAGATIRPNFCGFSFFYIGFGSFLLLFSSFYFLLIHLFLSFSSYLFSTILRLLILLFLYFKLFVVLQT